MDKTIIDNYITKLTKRLLSKVNKTESCWLWTGAMNSAGYGLFSFEGKEALAHRFSYRLFTGEIPDGLVILHSCDVRECINPEHLSVGTHTENMEDCLAKGRHNSQLSNFLDHTQKAEIRIKYLQNKVSMDKLASEYGVAKTTIFRAIHKNKSSR